MFGSRRSRARHCQQSCHECQSLKRVGSRYQVPFAVKSDRRNALEWIDRGLCQCADAVSSRLYDTVTTGTLRVETVPNQY